MMKKIKNFKGNVTIKNSIYLTISRFTRYGFMFIFTAICARYLGSNEYGVISYNLSQISIISLLFSLGADTYIVVQLSKNSEKANSLISINLMNRLLLMSTVTVFLTILNKFITIYSFNFVSVVIYFTAIFDSFRTVSDGFFQAKQKLKYVAIFEILRAVFLLIGAIIVIKLNKGLEGIAIVYFITSFIIFIASYYLLFIKYKIKLVKVKFIETINLIKNAFPFFINAIILILGLQIDIIMINNLAGNSQTAYYTTAKKVIDIVLMIPTIISMVFLPRISSNQVSKEESKKILKVIMGIGVIIGIFVYTISNIFVLLAFGNEYMESSTIIKIFCFGFPFIFANSFISTCLIGSGMQKKVVFVNSIGTVVNILLNLILIPKFLCTGAAIATLASIVINFLQFTWDYSKLKFSESHKKQLIIN
mgnify:CR=1 FL=1